MTNPATSLTNKHNGNFIVDKQPALSKTAISFAATLDFNNVSFAYGKNVVLAGISLSVNPGEIVCLLGLSGGGKTTMLRLAAGLECPDDGTINVDGRLASSKNYVMAPERRGIGYMFQNYALFPHMTVADNVKFGLKELNRRQSFNEAMALLARVGLTHRANHYPNDLSGGEQQRVALSRSLICRPRIMLMDEPFSGLDRILREQIRAETLAILREANITTIIVTHDPEEAMFLADRIVLLDDGKIIQSGHPEQLFNKPASIVVARFFSNLNELPAVVKDQRLSTPLGQFPAAGFADGETVTVALRPDAFTVTGLAKTSQGNSDDVSGITGVIKELRYLGQLSYLELMVDGLSHLIKLRVSLTNRLSIGQAVRLDINDNGWFIFAN